MSVKLEGFVKPYRGKNDLSWDVFLVKVSCAGRGVRLGHRRQDGQAQAVSRRRCVSHLQSDASNRPEGLGQGRCVAAEVLQCFEERSVSALHAAEVASG